MSQLVRGLMLRGWYVADGPEKAAVVEPVDPGEGRHLHLSQASPGSPLPDDLRLEEPDDGLGESVVVGIADAPDRAEVRQSGSAAGSLECRQLLAEDGILERELTMSLEGREGRP